MPEFLFIFRHSKQLDYYGVATTIYTMLMGSHCNVYYEKEQWKVPTIKRYGLRNSCSQFEDFDY